MAEPSDRLRAGLVAAFGFACAALLLALLFYYYPADAGELIAALWDARGLGLAGLVASTGLHCLISGHKWRLIARAGGANAKLGLGFYGFYSALIALAGQIMPLQIAVLAGRSMALRFHARVPLRRTAFGAIYDQGFDLLVPGLALIPGGLFLAGLLDGAAAVLLFGILLGVFGLLLGIWGARIIQGALGAGENWLPAALVRRSGFARAAAAAPVYLEKGLVLRLYLWSVLRGANLVFRAWLVVWCLSMNIGLPPLIFGHCAVAFSVLLNFVPGALGVAEWGWVSVLDLSDVDPDSAVRYAVSFRVLVVASLVAVNVLGALAVAAQRLKRRVSGGMAAPH